MAVPSPSRFNVTVQRIHLRVVLHENESITSDNQVLECLVNDHTVGAFNNGFHDSAFNLSHGLSSSALMADPSPRRVDVISEA